MIRNEQNKITKIESLFLFAMALIKNFNSKRNVIFSSESLYFQNRKQLIHVNSEKETKKKIPKRPQT